jgi:hypothetical protein
LAALGKIYRKRFRFRNNNNTDRFLNNEYAIKTFIIRPGRKNSKAIKAYEKCGFSVIDNFNANDYYGDDIGEWGDGDYGAEGTVNMIKQYK